MLSEADGASRRAGGGGEETEEEQRPVWVVKDAGDHRRPSEFIHCNRHEISSGGSAAVEHVQTQNNCEGKTRCENKVMLVNETALRSLFVFLRVNEYKQSVHVGLPDTPESGIITAGSRRRPDAFLNPIISSAGRLPSTKEEL